MVEDIRVNPKVSLDFIGEDDACISIVGKAQLIKDRDLMKQHWAEDLDLYFNEGIETPDIVMIQVVGQKVKYWQDEEALEVLVEAYSE